jgi:predicted Fe-Mo cluster-binding NifX family protein
MKIAIPVAGKELQSPIDSRFGRARQFLVFNDSDASYVLIDNEQDLNAAQGAGLQSASKVIEADAGCVILTHCGPKAFKLLASYDIKVYVAEDMTAEKALDMFKNGKLQEMKDADVEGHWV